MKELLSLKEYIENIKGNSKFRLVVDGSTFDALCERLEGLFIKKNDNAMEGLDGVIIEKEDNQ